MRQEAKAAGSKLESGGKGGLPPSLVLHVMRRDGYRCARCGSQDGVSVHHKGGIVNSAWAAKVGHSNDPGNIVTICHKCHDKVHDEARAEGVDSQQVLAVGDEGTRHDHGQDKVVGGDGSIKAR
jgi:5-methylcytosine-specific restriction endonuclease McrA